MLEYELAKQLTDISALEMNFTTEESKIVNTSEKLPNGAGS